MARSRKAAQRAPPSRIYRANRHRGNASAQRVGAANIIAIDGVAADGSRDNAYHRRQRRYQRRRRSWRRSRHAASLLAAWNYQPLRSNSGAAPS
jgi:hypothetical protein